MAVSRNIDHETALVVPGLAGTEMAEQLNSRYDIERLLDQGERESAAR